MTLLRLVWSFGLRRGLVLWLLPEMKARLFWDGEPSTFREAEYLKAEFESWTST